ncbi:hypothetical protein FOMPIDRAFT_1053022 [Fomitopsis schrenkii]|uniref:Replication protein A OB domain-containing protein n=1 Tax=Fomitopsis schrenkii TaxID=2126942 RepID=S8E0B5_FOMSC|nr:hypothetical protein FOMPIDRAFT_1053022 [Fomitopsis schrenkii]
MPTIRYNFVDLAKLTDPTPFVEVISPTELVSIKAGTTLQKHGLTLVDYSGYAVRLTLWGKRADSFVDGDQPVVAIRAANASDLGGHSLSMSSMSNMQGNSDIPEHTRCAGSVLGADVPYSHANTGAGRFAQFDRTAQVVSLNEVKMRQL